MPDDFRSRFSRSQRLAHDVIIPLVRDYCEIGYCRDASAIEDMRDKIDAVCDHCCDPERQVTLAIRCQVGRYSHYRTHTLRCTEVERLRDRSFTPPDWFVHAHMAHETHVCRIGLIRGQAMQMIVRDDDLKFRDAEGQKNRFATIEWKRHSWAVIEIGECRAPFGFNWSRGGDGFLWPEENP